MTRSRLEAIREELRAEAARLRRLEEHCRDQVAQHLYRVAAAGYDAAAAALVRAEHSALRAEALEADHGRDWGGGG